MDSDKSTTAHFSLLQLTVFDGAYQWSDGTYSATCDEYFSNPSYADEGSGLYWINPEGTAFKVFCLMGEMNSGWTHIFTVSNQDTHNPMYDDVFWSDSVGTYNENNPPLSLAEAIAFDYKNRLFDNDTLFEDYYLYRTAGNNHLYDCDKNWSIYQKVNNSLPSMTCNETENIITAWNYCPCSSCGWEGDTRIMIRTIYGSSEQYFLANKGGTQTGARYCTRRTGDYSYGDCDTDDNFVIFGREHK